jgi:hypothetical protein
MNFRCFPTHSRNQRNQTLRISPLNLRRTEWNDNIFSRIQKNNRTIDRRINNRQGFSAKRSQRRI